MYIARFKIENYKSFLSSQELDLTPGFNVVVGPNNVGKTALVEALSLRFDNRPHRSMTTFPHPGMQALRDCQRIKLSIEPVRGKSV